MDGVVARSMFRHLPSVAFEAILIAVVGFAKRSVVGEVAARTPGLYNRVRSAATPVADEASRSRTSASTRTSSTSSVE